MGSAHASAMRKVAEVCDRFGDYVCVDWVNLPCVSGQNQFINTKFTRPINKMSKTSDARAPTAEFLGRFNDSISAPPPRTKEGEAAVERRWMSGAFRAAAIAWA